MLFQRVLIYLIERPKEKAHKPPHISTRMCAGKIWSCSKYIRSRCNWWMFVTHHHLYSARNQAAAVDAWGNASIRKKENRTDQLTLRVIGKSNQIVIRNDDYSNDISQLFPLCKCGGLFTNTQISTHRRWLIVGWHRNSFEATLHVRLLRPKRCCPTQECCVYLWMIKHLKTQTQNGDTVVASR